MEKVRTSFRYFYLGFAYLVLVGILGECHPFTRYPMFSSFPNFADYYYVEDENGDFLATIPTFGRPTSEIKDLFSISIQNRGLDMLQLESHLLAASEVGSILAASIKPHVQAQQINIIYVTIWHENGSIRLQKVKIHCHEV